jgi:hypothetical protein
MAAPADRKLLPQSQEPYSEGTGNKVITVKAPTILLGRILSPNPGEASVTLVIFLAKTVTQFSFEHGDVHTKLLSAMDAVFGTDGRHSTRSITVSINDHPPSDGRDAHGETAI